ncbi:MAG: hypothetical protein E6J85_17895 [Deltaproteobacteria bacterium]|nr:MAG: hypothetical protein E6J85_17895 [Deltaproteobacteria bacterium]
MRERLAGFVHGDDPDADLLGPVGANAILEEDDVHPQRLGYRQIDGLSQVPDFVDAGRHHHRDLRLSVLVGLHRSEAALADLDRDLGARPRVHDGHALARERQRDPGDLSARRGRDHRDLRIRLGRRQIIRGPHIGAFAAQIGDGARAGGDTRLDLRADVQHGAHRLVGKLELARLRVDVERSRHRDGEKSNHLQCPPRIF